MAIPLRQSVNSEHENKQLSDRHIGVGETQQNETEVVSVTDLLMKSLFSQEG
jgi:hypothetical protein